MRELLTPKQVARALDVSESSVKRWCDKGVIPTHYTAGGHRRITLAAVREFLQNQKHKLVHPEALGLPVTSGLSARVVHRARDQFTQCLLAGDETRCRQVVMDLYLASHGTSVICDEILARSLRYIGELWVRGEAEIYQERRACEICLRVLHELRVTLPTSQPNAPLAIGGAPARDPYHLGTLMVELVLREAGWRAVSMGGNLPFETMAAAIREHRPTLFWLSCSHIEDEGEFLAQHQRLHAEFGSEVAVVVGGHALEDGIRQRMSYFAYCDNMQQLAGLAQGLFLSHAGEPKP